MSSITVDADNSHFRAFDKFLVDFAGISLLHFFGSDRTVTINRCIEILCEECFARCTSLENLIFESNSELRRIEENAFLSCKSVTLICIPASVEILCSQCFGCCSCLRTVTFESNSQLRRIEASAFDSCSQLQSICIPPLVEILSDRCFGQCESLSTVSFEPDSKLKRIDGTAFIYCSSLTSLFIPASVETIGDSAFSDTNISKIIVEDGNTHFRVCDNSLPDFSGISLIQSFDRRKNIRINRCIEILCQKCFYIFTTLETVEFESNSQMRRIEENAFWNCSSLKSICIPASVEIICERCFSKCIALFPLCHSNQNHN
jgi:hypothetical protein